MDTAMRILDLFCGAGGAAMGYHQALPSAQIVGIDNQAQPNYPFEFIQADALTPPVDLSSFDLIHASPPCQAYSIAGRAFPVLRDGRYPDLIPAVRNLIGHLPHVIENVPGAPLIEPAILCGSMFGLSAYDPDMGRVMHLRRHRLFEMSFPILTPPDTCALHRGSIAGVYGGGGNDRKRTLRDGRTQRGGYTPKADVRRALMGMAWVTMKEVNEAIPPAYTRFIGGFLS
jgi:DNA (cytosine-5)-methyltransferase 1